MRLDGKPQNEKLLKFPFPPVGAGWTLGIAFQNCKKVRIEKGSPAHFHANGH